VTYSGNGHDGGDVPVDANNPYMNGGTINVLGSSTLSLIGKKQFLINYS